MSNFYNIYVSLCAKHKKSKSKVAEEIGLSRASAYGWTNGAVPSDVNLKKIADYFGVTIEYLKGEEQAEKNPLPENEERIKQLYELTEGLTDEDINVLRAFAAGLKANRKND